MRLIVIDPPCFDLLPCIVERDEHLGIQAFVAKSTALEDQPIVTAPVGASRVDGGTRLRSRVPPPLPDYVMRTHDH